MVKDPKSKAPTIADQNWESFLKNVTPLKPRNEIERVLPKHVIVKIPSLPFNPQFDFGRDAALPLQAVSRKELKRAQIDGRLDLHGVTQDQAYNAFLKFTERSCTQGKKIILVITGKGAIENPSTLNKLLPRWCEEHPFNKMIKSVSSAKIEHGGKGAYYVFLRKMQSP